MKLDNDTLKHCIFSLLTGLGIQEIDLFMDRLSPVNCLKLGRAYAQASRGKVAKMGIMAKFKNCSRLFYYKVTNLRTIKVVHPFKNYDVEVSDIKMRGSEICFYWSSSMGFGSMRFGTHDGKFWGDTEHMSKEFVKQVLIAGAPMLAGMIEKGNEDALTNLTYPYLPR